jgi:threonine dehydrogenase-like Zn-dependent dehydrogenase
VFPAKRAVQVIDHPEPDIESPTQVKVRILEVGVCGTDREITSFEYGTPPEGSDYLILGHESLGQVVATGTGVSKVLSGDLVVMTVRRPCPHPSCIACRSGRQDFCYTGDFTERGIKQRHGFMSEFVVEEEEYLNVGPSALREVAVLVEPLTIAEKSLEQLRIVQQRLPWSANERRQAVVLGAGPVGLLGAMALRAAGFEVALYSRESKEKQVIVEAIGARYVVAEKQPISRLAEVVGRIDVVYEAIGASGLAFEAIKQVGPNGVFIFTGVPGRKGPIEVDTDALMRDLVLNNQAIVGTVNAPPHSFEAAIRDLGTFLQKWPNAVRALITARFPLDEALQPLLNPVGGIKNLVTIAS